MLLLASVATAFAQDSTMKKNMNETLAPYRYDVHYAALNDTTEIAYIDEGEGTQTLIFIHGLATYLPSWYPVVEGLKKHFRCIAIDLPGYGRSSKKRYPAKLSFYAEAILQLIEQLELENPVLVGHSMGGQVAVTTALKAPEQFEKLILLAPAGFETFSDPQKTALKSVTTVAAIRDANETQIRNNWKMNFYDMPESVEFMIEDRINMREASDFRYYCQSVVNGVSAMLNEPIFENLKQLQTNTLVMYGANDALIPNRFLNPKLTTQSVAEAGVKEIPQSRLELLPNCGHFITYEQAELVNRGIRQFLQP